MHCEKMLRVWCLSNLEETGVGCGDIYSPNSSVPVPVRKLPKIESHFVSVLSLQYIYITFATFLSFHDFFYVYTMHEPSPMCGGKTAEPQIV